MNTSPIKPSFLACALLLSALLCAQTDTPDQPEAFSTAEIDTTLFPFIAYWSVGDTFNFEVTKIENIEKDGVVTKADTNIYRSKLEVIDSSADHYLLKYTIGEYVSNNRRELTTDEMAAIGQFSNLESIIYRTDEYGTFVRLENWQDFAVAMDTLFEHVIINQLQEQTVISEELFRRAIAPMRDIYTSESGILNKVVEEIVQLHFPFGSEFTVGDTALYNDTLGNLFGGRAIGTENRMYIEEASWSDDYVELRYFLNLTPDGAETMTKMMIAYLPGVTDTPHMEAIFKSAVVTLEDDNWYAFYNYPGIPISIDNDRYLTCKINGGQEIRHNKLLVRWVD